MFKEEACDLPAVEAAGPLDYLKAWPQYLLPGHLVSRLMWALARIRHPATKNRLIDTFIKRFRVDLSEAVECDPHAYPDFNSFFVRPLKDGARPVVSGADEIACPVDGMVSQLGRIEEGRIFQAKGHDYSVVELLGGLESRAAPFLNGSFATIYLSPRDYHRVHMPLDGQLREMVHVPGRLFSVSPATTRAVPRLFARNERITALFETEAGPMALVLVGAVVVGSIETAWSGVVTPPAGRVVRRWLYDNQRLARGEEMGRFNIGSTVIVLFGPGAVSWDEKLSSCSPVRMGQLLARRAASRPDLGGEPEGTAANKPVAEESDQVACSHCLKEVPSSTTQAVEGSDCVRHFCGLECLEESQRQPENDGKAG